MNSEVFNPYDEAGHELIPLNKWDLIDQRGVERGKSPFHTNWRVRPADNRFAMVWFEEDRGNVGVRLRKTDIVIDFDPRNAPEGRDVIAELEAKFNLGLDAWPHVKTGGGGDHWYGKIPADTKVVNQLKDFPGVEFKAYGRQVVAAGSKHPSGGFYEMDDFAPDFKDAPKIPAALLEAVKRRAGIGPAGIATRIPIDHLQRCLDQINVEEFRDHGPWFELMQACHYAVAGNEDGRDIFIAWSTGDPQFSGHGADIEYRWDSLDPFVEGGVTTATLYLRVDEAGGNPTEPAANDFDVYVDEEPEDPERPRPRFERDNRGRPAKTVPNAMEAICGLGLRPIHNNVSDRDFVAGVGADSFFARFPGLVTREMNDAVAQALAEAAFREYQIDVSVDMMLNAAERLALQNAFDPIHDYLNGLEWDGVKRLDTWLCKYAGAEVNDYNRAVGRITLLGAVARAFRPAIEYQTMTVLEGQQGSLKSSMLRILGGEWTLPGLPMLRSASDKDVVDAMIGTWIIEVDELENLKKADIATMKAFLSRESDTVRLAYARRTKTYPRRCIFIGTTNEAEYLRDATGNRRFLPVRIGKIMLDTLSRDRDQLWAETVHIWKTNPKRHTLVLDQSLWAVAAEEQEDRRLQDPAEEVIEEYIYHKREGQSWVATSDILAECFGEMNRTSISAQRITRDRLPSLMQRIGWRRSGKRVDGLRGYERIKS